MAIVTQARTAKPQRPVTYERVYVWELGIRAFHWINAAAMTVLFLTGLYISSPTFSSTSGPNATPMMALVRLVHFAAAFVFAVALAWRLYFFFFGNQYSRSGFPAVWRSIWWKQLTRQSLDYLRLRFGHPHLEHNALAGLSYALCVIGLGWLQVFTGFALYSESNPGGIMDRLFGWVLPLFGGSFRTHMWHHLFAWGFLAFVIVHIYIVFLDSRQYRNGLISSMITGFKFRAREEDTDER